METNQEQAAEQQDQGTEQKKEQKKEKQEQAEQQAPADNYKAEIAGLNRKVAELKKQLDQANMTAEQKAEAARKEKKQLEQETINLRRSLAIEKELADANIPQDLADRVIGNTPEEIQEDIQKFKTYLDGLVKERTAGVVTSNIEGPPKGGDDEPAMSYDDIARMKDHKERMRLYRQYGYIK